MFFFQHEFIANAYTGVELVTWIKETRSRAPAARQDDCTIV
jgi:hypothetical protein